MFSDESQLLWLIICWGPFTIASPIGKTVDDVTNSTSDPCDGRRRMKAGRESEWMEDLGKGTSMRTPSSLHSRWVCVRSTIRVCSPLCAQNRALPLLYYLNVPEVSAPSRARKLRMKQLLAATKIMWVQYGYSVACGAPMCAQRVKWSTAQRYSLSLSQVNSVEEVAVVKRQHIRE